ncbi:alpha/beta hydrolase fold-1 [Cordyceps militaris CM01]|uniref:Alpha/beta hydrolase fold-1 n=1 Tax=Cordyceps militaris (strain CM01) TaxID=983644 RepID=G3JC36_CORMM|nr:alpha/beta hydrolase fold-1 [Cordyceps militaris CM01]EGX94551.1 alpha/beta hydrolase fold-1 [Cordyceps militaris CM01]
MAARTSTKRLLRVSSGPMSSHATASASPPAPVNARATSGGPPNPAHNQTIKLPDGRALGFAEYGDARGRKTLLYFHGYPSSRVEAKVLDRLARAHSIRVLALDRPGYGLSTPQRPRRALLDWPRDVAAFAASQRLDRFAVLGTSGGGPFAVACAHALAPCKLAAVGLFAGAPPWAAGRHLMTRGRRVLRVLANWCPGLLGAGAALALRLARWLVGTRWVTARLDAWLVLVNQQARDKEAARREADPAARPSTVLAPDDRPVAEQRAALLNLLIGEPFAQGFDGAVQEARILTDDDWGFRLEDVAFRHAPIKIWHGTKDANAPIEAIRYLAERLPNAELHEYSQDTHYTMGDHIEEALLDLMDETDRGEKMP